MRPGVMKSRFLPALGVYLGVLLLVLGPSLNTAFALAGGDWTDLIYPFHWLSKSVFSEEGRLPFWNPYIFSGQPHLASLNVLVFYPTELLSLMLPLESSTFYTLDLIFHLWAAGTGLFLFLRYCGLSRGASFFGGLSFMLGGHLFSLAGAGHPHVVRCLAWFPLLFYLLKRAEDDGRLVWYALSGGVVSLFVLTSAVQLAVYAAVVIAFWVALTGRGRIGGKLAGLGVLFLVLAGSGAVLLLPGFEHYLNSIRLAPEKGFSAAWSLSGWDMLTWLVPGIFGHVSYYCGPHLFRTSTDYFGLLPLGFAVLSFACAPRPQVRWLVLGVAGVVLAFGGGAMPASFPVFSGFRNSLRWLSFTHMAVSILAAYGWEYAVGGRRKRVLVAAAVLACFGVLCGFLAAGKDAVAGGLEATSFYRRHAEENLVDLERTRECVGSALRNGMVSGLASGAAMALAGLGSLPVPACAAVVWTVTALDLLFGSHGYFLLADAARKQPDPIAGFLMEKAADGRLFRVATDEYFGMPNQRMYWKLEWTWGYHGVPLERYVRFHKTAVEIGTATLFSVLNTKYIVSRPGGVSTESVARFVSQGGETISVFENPGVMPRAWLARRVLFCKDLECAIDAMRTPGYLPDYAPVEGLSSAQAGVEPASARGRIEFRWGRDEMFCTVDLDDGGVLVFSEIWYPAWKAFVDGRRVPVMKAYGALRAVCLPSGKHGVEMIYDSLFFKLGLWFSAMTVVVLGVAVLAGRKAC